MILCKNSEFIISWVACSSKWVTSISFSGHHVHCAVWKFTALLSFVKCICSFSPTKIYRDIFIVFILPFSSCFSGCVAALMWGYLSFTSYLHGFSLSLSPSVKKNKKKLKQKCVCVYNYCSCSLSNFINFIPNKVLFIHNYQIQCQ